MNGCFSFWKECNELDGNPDNLSRSERLSNWKAEAALRVKQHIIDLMSDHITLNETVFLQMKYFREDSTITEASPVQKSFTENIHTESSEYDDVDVILALTYQYTHLERCMLTENIQNFVNIKSKVKVWSIGLDLDFDPWSISSKEKIRIPTAEGGFTAYVYHVQKILPPSIVLGKNEKWEEPEKNTNHKLKKIDSKYNSSHQTTTIERSRSHIRRKRSSRQRRSSASKIESSEKKAASKIESSEKKAIHSRENSRRKSIGTLKLKNKQTNESKEPIHSTPPTMPPTINQLDKIKDSLSANQEEDENGIEEKAT